MAGPRSHGHAGHGHGVSVRTDLRWLTIALAVNALFMPVEIARALRPGGELRFYEHVVSNRPSKARVQRGLDPTIYSTLAGGCHARDTRATILDAGFQIDREERMAFKPSPITTSIPTSSAWHDERELDR